MEVVKQTKEYTIYQKRSKRYAVRNAEKKWINGEEKVAILVKEKLLKVAIPKPKPKEEEAPAEEAPAAEGSEEAPAEES